MTDRSFLVVVSGLSGAGRTTAMKALEDLGFYCVDNLPVVLLERFVELFSEGARHLAAVIDAREREFLESFPGVYERMREGGAHTELLFLDASDEVLARRFDETRRVHPAGRGRPIRESIAEERELLRPLASRADVLIDTSALTVHDLKRIVTRRYSGARGSGPMEVELLSFGFRYGCPEVADLMLDVRFLPNPNYEPGLRDLTGQDPEVARYVMNDDRTQEFLKRLLDFLDYLIPLYAEEGKAVLTIGVGCTGGQHRSVAIAEALEERLGARKIKARVRHRDVDRQRRVEP